MTFLLIWRNQQIFVQNFYSVRLFEGHSQFDEIKAIRGRRQFVYPFIRQTSLLFQGLSESPTPRILVSCSDPHRETSFWFLAPLRQIHSAVHVEDAAGDVAGLVAAQKHKRGPYSARRTHAAQRNTRFQSFLRP